MGCNKVSRRDMVRKLAEGFSHERVNNDKPVYVRNYKVSCYWPLCNCFSQCKLR